MKLKTIINVFGRKNRLENPLILKTLDTINDFNRKMDLKPAYRELKQIYEDYEEEREKLVKKLIKEYCDQENKRNEKVDSWEILDSEKIDHVPASKMEEYASEIKKRGEKEIELKNPLLFYKDEIERAKLVFSEEEIIDEFVNWKKDKPTKKKANK